LTEENDSCRMWTRDRIKEANTGKKINSRQNESEEENDMIVATLRRKRMGEN